jgi:hypothetical protein
MAIINTLATSPKTPKELRKEVVTKQGVPKSSYHYTIKQMVKSGEVEEPKYRYIGNRVSDQMVREVLLPTMPNISPEVEIELSKNLQFIARRSGVGMHPVFRSKLQEYLKSKNEEVHKAALVALSDTLWHLSESPDDKKTRNIIDQEFFALVENIVRNDSDLDCRGRAVRILPELDNVAAIDVVVSLIEKTDEREYEALEHSIKQAIVWRFDRNRRPRNFLTLKHHARILNILSNMAAKGNKRASELADGIRRGGEP